MITIISIHYNNTMWFHIKIAAYSFLQGKKDNYTTDTYIYIYVPEFFFKPAHYTFMLAKLWYMTFLL